MYWKSSITKQYQVNIARFCLFFGRVMCRLTSKIGRNDKFDKIRLLIFELN